jgi:hypothetical protein
VHWSPSHLIGFAGNLLGSSADPKAVAAVFALPLVVRLWILTEVITEEIMFRGYFWSYPVSVDGIGLGD